MCVCVCVCVRERERVCECMRERACIYECIQVYMQLMQYCALNVTVSQPDQSGVWRGELDSACLSTLSLSLTCSSALYANTDFPVD